MWVIFDKEYLHKFPSRARMRVRASTTAISVKREVGERAISLGFARPGKGPNRNDKQRAAPSARTVADRDTSADGPADDGRDSVLGDSDGDGTTPSAAS